MVGHRPAQIDPGPVSRAAQINPGPVSRGALVEHELRAGTVGSVLRLLWPRVPAAAAT